MIGLLALVVAMPLSNETGTEALLFPEPLVSLSDEREPHLLPAEREPSKKEIWRREKACRPERRIADADLVPPRPHREPPGRTGKTSEADRATRLDGSPPPAGRRIEPVTTLYNVWNRDSLPLLAGIPYRRPFQLFLRDHYTHGSTQADIRLAGLLAAAALKFGAPRVEIVSGYRSPKYNLMLRKKGHQVARESQHMQGTAIDFRIRGVSTENLRDFVRGLRIGGVGYYPRTRFIHADTAKVRYWKGS